MQYNTEMVNNELSQVPNKKLQHKLHHFVLCLYKEIATVQPYNQNYILTSINIYIYLYIYIYNMYIVLTKNKLY